MAPGSSIGQHYTWCARWETGTGKNLPNHPRSPGCLGQEDNNMVMAPPVCKYHMADYGHQEGDTHEENKFVGPGSRVYHNYHKGLNDKCDVHDQFLPDNAPPSLGAQKSPNDWTPYCNQLDFELTEFLFAQAEMPAKKIDMLLEIWAASLLALGREPLYANHTDLYHVIDSISLARLSNNMAPWMSNTHNVWYQDPHKVIHNLLACTDFIGEMNYVPYWKYDAANDKRCWQDFMSGDWAWQEADRIISEDPTTVRATLILIILGSNKTTVLVATGQTNHYPLYLSIRNVHNTVCHAHCNAVVLIAFLTMPKVTREHANAQEFHNFKRQLFHSSLVCILQSLHPAMKVPETVLFGDKYFWHIIYGLAAYIADYEEQALLSCIVNLNADALYHHHEHAERAIDVLDLQNLWEKYGIICDIVLFTNNFPCVDIYPMLSPNILHQLIKGGFKDHIVNWVKWYLIHIHRRMEAETFLGAIDQWITVVAPFTRLHHFPQGDDSKGLMKVYLAAIEGYVPRDIIHTFHAFLEFSYLVCHNIIMEQTLHEINNTLGCFHHFHEVFWNAGVINLFLLPQQHAMKHYHYLICQFGASNGLCSSTTESKHIKAIKHPYQCTNHYRFLESLYQALGQLLLINQWLNKLAAVHADFNEHGMLSGTHLFHVLDTLGASVSLMGQTKETDNQDSQVADGHGTQDEFKGQTASYEEDSGDTVDIPMSIEAHHARNVKDLTAELGILQLPDILCHFLHSQINPDDTHDLEHVPLDECPLYDGGIWVYNSACSTFFAPSDLSGIYSMCHEYIHSCPMWRNDGPCFDCAKGMCSLDVVCVLCFFSFRYMGKLYLCAIVHWLNHVGDAPDGDTGMWIVCPAYHAHNLPNVAIIHIDTIYCTAHLIPIYAGHNIDVRDVRPHQTYDKFHSFCGNKFADYHAFEISFC
ncbi:hypothetical protein J3A83DRAFT_4360405 [Scleroderma citrinum]